MHGHPLRYEEFVGNNCYQRYPTATRKAMSSLLNWESIAPSAHTQASSSCLSPPGMYLCSVLLKVMPARTGHPCTDVAVPLHRVQIGQESKEAIVSSLEEFDSLLSCHLFMTAYLKAHHL